MMNLLTIARQSTPNTTGMLLSEFKKLLAKVLNAPGELEALAAGGIIPTGGIIMWAGSSVPTGWYLCDGTNGTPDLTAKFVLGGAIVSIGTTASQVDTVVGNHSAHSDHIVTQPSAHVVDGPSATQDIADTGAGTNMAHGTHIHALTNNHSGAAVDAHSAHSAHSVTTQFYPAYYTLAYLMKG